MEVSQRRSWCWHGGCGGRPESARWTRRARSVDDPRHGPGISVSRENRMCRAYTWLERSEWQGTEDIERFVFLWIAFSAAYGDESARREFVQAREARETEPDRFRAFLGITVQRDEQAFWKGSSGTSSPVRSGSCCRTDMCTIPSGPSLLGWLCGVLTATALGDAASKTAKGSRWRHCPTGTSPPCWQSCSTGSRPCATRHSTTARPTPVVSAGTRFRSVAGSWRRLCRPFSTRRALTEESTRPLVFQSRLRQP